MAARLLPAVVGIAGLCALVLGLFIWIANSALTDLHILFGLLVTVGLLVMSLIALTTRAVRGLHMWGIVGIVYALIVLIFGVVHSMLLVGNLHWLIQTLHALVGIGAIVLTGLIGARYRMLRRSNASPTIGSQALH